MTITIKEMASKAAQYGLDSSGIEVSGVACVSPEQFQEITGVKPVFGSAASVLYRCSLQGKYLPAEGCVSYSGQYPYTSQSVGGMVPDQRIPVEFVVTRPIE